MFNPECYSEIIKSNSDDDVNVMGQSLARIHVILGRREV